MVDCMDWKKVLIGAGILDLVAVNAGGAYLVYKFSILNSYSNSKVQISNDQKTDSRVTDEGCDRDCVASMEARLAILESKIGDDQGVATPPAPTKKILYPLVSPKPKVRTSSYLTVPGSGSSSKNDWESLSGTEFYFDTGDYPGLADVYFEVNIKLYNGNGMAYVRLYDSTHGVGVQGGEVQTKLQANSVVTSGRVTFWGGRNLIKVQAKSLTADTPVFNSGRLKIITEN